MKTDLITVPGTIGLAAAAGAANLLPKRGPGAWPASGDDGVEARDVNTEFQRVRRSHRADGAIA